MTANLLTLTVREAMKRTGFPRNTIYRLVKNGDWRVVRTGLTSFRIFEASMNQWFEQQQSAPARASDVDRELPAVKDPAFQ